MKVGDAKRVISADDKASAKMQNVGKSTGNLAGKFNMLKVAIIGATVALGAFMVKSVKDWTALGDQLDKMTDRTGIAVEKLAELAYVLDLSGTSLETFEKANKTLSKVILDASFGLATYVRLFEELGLDIKDLKRMSPEEQFWAVANALAAVENVSTRIGLAQQIFGRAGTALLPMLAEGTEGIRKMQEEFAEYGYQWTAAMATSAADLNDATTRLKAAWDKIRFTLIDELKLDERLDKLSEYLKKVPVWLEANKDTINSLVDVAVAVGKTVMFFFKVLEWLGNRLADMTIFFMKLHDLLTVGFDFQKNAADYKIAMPTQEALDIPSMQSGGIVPGPFGQPTPIMAHGGEVVSGLHGEAMGTTVNISMGNFMGDENSLREFARTLKDVLGQDTRRTSFPGVNKLGYFQGSSAP